MRNFKVLQHYITNSTKKHHFVVNLDRDEAREGLLERLQAEGVSVDDVPIEIDGIQSNAIHVLREGSTLVLRCKA